MATTSPASASDAFTIDAPEATRLTGLSPETLERRSNAGESTGRVPFVKTRLRSLADRRPTTA